MPAAAVLSSATSHPGMIAGPGVPTVLIGGLPAAVAGDQHVCAFPVPPGHPPNAIVTGSAKVMIGGRPAARVGDSCACGAQIVSGVLTVNIA
jgi:uncharacterized Zn-binding protein involved in type VI secretion